MTTSSTQTQQCDQSNPDRPLSVTLTTPTGTTHATMSQRYANNLITVAATWLEVNGAGIDRVRIEVR